MYKRFAKVFLIGAVLVALLFQAVGSYASTGDQGVGKVDLAAPHVPGRILVKFEGRASHAQRLQAHALQGGAVLGEISQLGVQVVRVPTEKMAEALASYRANANVVYAEPDYLAYGTFTPDDEYYTTLQYGPQKIQANLAWDITTGNPNVIVAVVDSGADFSHPDLQGKLLAGWDYVNGDADPSDDYGHGTHVAGIVGAGTNNTAGIAGIGFNTRLLVVKVLDQYNSGSYSNIALGITYAADQGARIINLSLGGYADSTTLRDAVEYAWNRGALLVAAAGNGATSNPFYPAAYVHVMGVSGTNASDGRLSISNYGDYVSVSAPGDSIYSTNWVSGSSGYGYRSGTSQAAPHVSGVAALLLAQDGSRTNTQLWSIIESTADDIGPAGRDPYFGYGRVNAYKALSNGQPAPTPTPVPPTPTPTPVPPTPTPTPTPVPPTPTPTPVPPTPTPTPTPVPPTPTPTPGSSAMHVGDLDGASTNVGKNWKATVTITVHDATHNPVVSSTVNGSWSGGYSGSASCITDSTGRCSVTTGAINSKTSSATFTVNTVSHATLTYQSAANHDPDGDSNGTQITVYKP